MTPNILGTPSGLEILHRWKKAPCPKSWTRPAMLTYNTSKLEMYFLRDVYLRNVNLKYVYVKVVHFKKESYYVKREHPAVG
jgi:hypothetical protein